MRRRHVYILVLTINKNDRRCFGYCMIYLYTYMPTSILWIRKRQYFHLVTPAPATPDSNGDCGIWYYLSPFAMQIGTKCGRKADCTTLRLLWLHSTKQYRQIASRIVPGAGWLNHTGMCHAVLDSRSVLSARVIPSVEAG